jgi:hypothetical protein
MSGTSVLRANTKNRWKQVSGNFGARKAGVLFSFGTLALLVYLAAHQASDGLLSVSPESIPLTLNSSILEAAALVKATSSPVHEAQVKDNGTNEHGFSEHGLQEPDSQIKDQEVQVKERTTGVEGHETQLAAIPIFFFMTEVKTSVALLLNITATFNPEAPLYMLTSSQTPPADGVLEELKRSGVKVFYFDPKPEAGSDVDIFRRHYVHRSVNEEWYEMMCFERFLILEKVALQEGVERLFYFDADTVLFKDLRETPYRRHEDCGFVGLTHLSSYNALWRIGVLQQFCKYLLYFYKVSPPEPFLGIAVFSICGYMWGFAAGGNDLVKGGNILLKGGNDLVKGGNILIKGGIDLVKGGNILVKGGNDLVEGGNDLVKDRELLLHSRARQLGVPSTALLSEALSLSSASCPVYRPHRLAVYLYSSGSARCL